MQPFQHIPAACVSRCYAAYGNGSTSSVTITARLPLSQTSRPRTWWLQHEARHGKRCLLVLFALLLYIPSHIPGGTSSSIAGTQVIIKLDARQLQEAVAGFVGHRNGLQSDSTARFLDPNYNPQATYHRISTSITPTSPGTAAAGIAAAETSAGSTSAGQPAAVLLQPSQTNNRSGSSNNPSFELPGDPEELTSCLNTHQPLNTSATSWSSALQDTPSSYKVVGMWWSHKPADVPMTITTQLSWNRKWQLKAMCRSWGGPIAAVMHLPVFLPRLTRSHLSTLMDVSPATMQRTVDQVATFHAHLEASQPCKLDLMLLAEPYRDAKALVLYPVNTLRNYARLMARTPLIGLIDVDLIVSSSLRTELLQPTAAEGYLREAEEAAVAAAEGRVGPRFSTGASRINGLEVALAVELNLTGEGRSRGGSRSAWVLPAFETRGGSVSVQLQRAEKLAAEGSKVKLKLYYIHGKVCRFDSASTGHRNTEYGKWFNTTEPYIVDWTDRYEPWVMVDRLTSSWADARFRGYGKNKIGHVRTLAYDGYDLRVQPSAFLIHRPHLESSSSNAHARGALYGNKTRTSSMYGHNVHLYKMMQISMAYGNYTPAVDVATEACRDKLSWWHQRPVRRSEAIRGGAGSEGAGVRYGGVGAVVGSEGGDGSAAN